MNHRLHTIAPMPLHIVWHENKTTYLSIRKQKKAIHLRLHRLFYNAPTPVLEAVIQYALKNDCESRAVLKQMAHLHFSQTHVPVELLNPLGKTYNLQELFDRFQQTLQIGPISIGWSERSRKGKFRALTFGTFDKHRCQIRINPILDDPEVPAYFLEFVVYHEMLHAVCPTTMDSRGRCSIHTKEFRERERQFPHYQIAKAWEKQSLTFFKKRQSHGRS